MPGKPTTILQVIPRLDTGGAELAVLELTEALASVGARALVASEGGRMADEIARLGGELIRLGVATKNPITMWRNVARLERLIAGEGVDLVHARSRAPAWSARAAARRAGVRFVTTYHGAYGEKGRFKRFYNAIMADGDLVIANSRYTAQLIEARYGTPPERLRIIYRGVDLRAFDPVVVGAHRVDELRARWNLGSGDRVILNAARLTGWKGQRVLIDAAEILYHQGALANAVVVLAGDDQGRGGYGDELRWQISAAGLDGRVLLAGHCADMPAAFALADLAVVASIEPEAFGRAGAEAQAMGCPVIATDIGAPPETVRATPAFAPYETTGWLVPPGNADALANCIGSALEMDGPDRQAMAERAQANVRENFSLRQMKRNTLAAYDELLGSDLAGRSQRAETGRIAT